MAAQKEFQKLVVRKYAGACKKELINYVLQMQVFFVWAVAETELNFKVDDRTPSLLQQKGVESFSHSSVSMPPFHLGNFLHHLKHTYHFWRVNLGGMCGM